MGRLYAELDALRLDAETSLQLDLEFHLLLAHAAQNPLLVALCR